MKKTLLFVLAAALMVMSGNDAFAQKRNRFGSGPDSSNCKIYLSYYDQYFKQKNYDEAIPNWRKAYKYCPPTASKGMIVNGTTLMRRLIAKTTDKAHRDALVDTLMALHDIRAEHYPNDITIALNNKGTDVINYKKNDSKALYDNLGDIIGKLDNKTKSSILMFHLQSAINLYQEGKIGAEDVINVYQKNIALLDNAAVKTDNDAKVKSDMEGLFISSKVASCENLIALFTPRFEADPNNLELSTNIVRMMSNTDDCTNNELFLKAATSMHKLQPSAESAYFLYRLNASKGNDEEAMKYLEEAIANPSIDPSSVADYNYQLAAFAFKNNQYGKALSAAQIAADKDPANFAGKAYMIIANIWASTNCGGDEIQRRAKYWVACDYMNKAKAADASLADDCNRAIGQYSVYFPKTEDAFMYDLSNGQAYTVSCGGLRATTTVRTQK